MKINTKQYARHMFRLKAGALKNAVVRGIRSGALRALPALVSATDLAVPASAKGSMGAVNTGRFRRSWKSRALPTGADVHNDAPYSGVIEGGRRAGTKQPPTKPLAKWAQRRLGLDESEAKSVAFAIARAIKQRGLYPRNVLKKTLKTILLNIDREIRHELEAEAARV